MTKSSCQTKPRGSRWGRRRRWMSTTSWVCVDFRFDLGVCDFFLDSCLVPVLNCFHIYCLCCYCTSTSSVTYARMDDQEAQGLLNPRRVNYLRPQLPGFSYAMAHLHSAINIETTSHLPSLLPPKAEKLPLTSPPPPQHHANLPSP